MSDHWREVTSSSPCVICRKPDWCGRTDDGEAHRCMRIADPPLGWRCIKSNGDGGAVFVLDDGSHIRQPSRPPVSNARKPPRVHLTREAALESLSSWSTYKGATRTEYPYTNYFIVVRFDLPGGGKDFRPISLHPDGWRISDPSGKLPLYRADDLCHTMGRVHVVEGERCADQMHRLGLTAVTSAHGSKSAARSDWSALAGREVVIMPDFDDPGRVYGEKAAGIITALDPPATVKIVELPNVPDGGDVCDWVAHYTCREDDELCHMLDELVEAAPEYQPAPTVEANEPLAWQPFPTRLLPEPVRTYVKENAKAIGVDESYIAVPMLGAIAGSIGLTHTVRIKQDYFQPAILWMIFVGESGTMKDPALDAVMRVIREKETEAMQEHEAAMAEFAEARDRFKTEVKAWEKETASDDGSNGAKPERPERPVCRRCMLDDITIEALACVLQENPRGLLAAYPEAAIWFRSMGEHKSGRGSDDAKWIKTYDAAMLSVDRKNIDRPRVFVPHAAVSIVGAIQPGILRSELLQRRLDSGMIARFWIVHPPEDNVVQLSDHEASSRARDNMDALFLRLLALKARSDGTPHVVKLSPEAWAIYRKYIQGEHTRDIDNSAGHLRSAYAKDKGRIARLALILHLTKSSRHNYRPEDAGVIDGETMREAVDLVRWFKRETARVYARFIAPTGEVHDQKLLEWLYRRENGATPSDVVRGCRWIANVDEATKQLNALLEAGFGRWENPPPGPAGGRPSRRFYLRSQGSCCDPVYETPAQDSGKGGCVDVAGIDTQETNDDDDGGHG